MSAEKSPHYGLNSWQRIKRQNIKNQYAEEGARGHEEFNFEEVESGDLPKALRTHGPRFRKKAGAQRALRIVIPQGSLLTTPFTEMGTTEKLQADQATLFDIVERIHEQDDRFNTLASQGLLTKEWKHYGQKRGFKNHQTVNQKPLNQ